MPDDHPITQREFDESTGGFYEVFVRIADALEWLVEDKYREREGRDRDAGRPVHMRGFVDHD